MITDRRATDTNTIPIRRDINAMNTIKTTDRETKPIARESYIMTDMAVERLPSDVESTDGISVREETVRGFHVHRLTVTVPRDGIADAGSYVTLTVGKPWMENAERTSDAAETLSEIILELCASSGSPRKTAAMILCLGNRDVTADAVGPLCADGVIATRHLETERPEIWDNLGRVSLSVLAPGVYGKTGIEAFELTSSAVKTAKPQLVITVDALSARDTARLGTSIQVTNVGIAPGSGVGNHRMAITPKTLGVPVISIGVPTIAHSATLIRDALESGLQTLPENALEAALNVGRDLFVTPRDCDTAVNSMADIVSRAVNLTFLGFQTL